MAMWKSTYCKNHNSNLSICRDIMSPIIYGEEMLFCPVCLSGQLLNVPSHFFSATSLMIDSLQMLYISPDDCYT